MARQFAPQSDDDDEQPPSPQPTPLRSTADNTSNLALADRSRDQTTATRFTNLFESGSSSRFEPSREPGSSEVQDLDVQQDAADATQQSLPTLNDASTEYPPGVAPTDQGGSPRVMDVRHVPKVQKDADNVDESPRAPGPGLSRQTSTTLTTLSRLFAVHAAKSPDNSRSTSFMQSRGSGQQAAYSRNISSQTAPLPTHLYNRGLLEGRHSDITVLAFSCSYKLHRLILDRAPFFASALSEPWLEASKSEISIHPEDVDNAITQTSFELALKRLYGCHSVSEEDSCAMGLFATGCWLEMQDLVDSSVESILRYMTPQTLAYLIRFVSGKYYGRAGEKILASAKSMLCRDGSVMPIKFWDNIPGEVVREIVGGDGFFVENEWDRWVLAKRILDRRLRNQANEAGLVEESNRRKPLKAPDAAGLMAVRFDAVYRKSEGATSQRLADNLQKWLALYTNPDLEPILVLLDEGIHYIHLEFEQLQYIRQAKDVLGLPMLPEKVVSNALWQQMELRQRIMNANDTDLELNISIESSEPDPPHSTEPRSQTAQQTSSKGKGKQSTQRGYNTSETEQLDKIDDLLDSGSWDGNGKPRKFWIPSSDCNIVMGGNADPVIATSNTTTLQRHASRLSATIQPEDIQWAADFTAATSTASILPRQGCSERGESLEVVPIRYSHFPPFRFSAEFPNPRVLKNSRRVYSRTVFYAGSFWNVYIQKAASARSRQLGVYLHRAKESETEDVVSGTNSLNVDERIGQLEREIIMRSEHFGTRRQRRRQRITSDRETSEPETIVADYISSNHEQMYGDEGEPTASFANFLDRRSTSSKDMQEGVVESCSQSGTSQLDQTPDAESDDSDLENVTAKLTREAQKSRVATLPPYVDARPTIKTYFKIYSPSRGGRMLSVYESAPDKFNFSQSWGWKSSTLMLDEGLSGEDDDDIKDDEEQLSVKKKKLRNDRLKFSVVIGLI